MSTFKDLVNLLNDKDKPAAKEPVDEIENVVESEDQSPEQEAPQDDAELVISRNIAKRFGWADKPEWRGRPEDWTDAPQFLERQAETRQTERERLRRMNQVAEELATQARERGRREAEEELRRAAREGDEDAAVQAMQAAARYVGPPPEVSGWIARNSWFTSDPVAQAVARRISDDLAAKGLPVSTQLEEAEKVVRQRFPEHFQSQTNRKEAPVLERPNGRQAMPQTREKGMNEIPSGDRVMIRQQAKAMADRFGKTLPEMEKTLATAYWQEKGSN